MARLLSVFLRLRFAGFTAFTGLRLLLLLLSAGLSKDPFASVGHLEVSLLVFTLKLLLGLLIELVDEVFDGLGIVDGLGLSSLLDRDQSDVVLGSSNNFLGVTETSVEAFVLRDLQDGEVLTALTTSNNAGNQGTLKLRSH